MSANYANNPNNTNNSNTNNPTGRIRKNTALYTIFAVLGLFLIILIAYMAFSKDSHYDKGMKYLQAKDYNSALMEFQNVSPGDKEFRRAQNKINYINGYKAFNEGNFDKAKVYLSEIDPADEYYNESKLMLDKIAGDLRETELQTQLAQEKNKKDTVIIKQKEPVNNKNNEKEKNPVKNKDEEISKKYVTRVENLMNKFQSVYQSAENASVESKKNYVSNMSSIMSQLNSLSYSAGEKNAMVVDLKIDAAKWMSKRIDYINKLISENSVGVTNTTRMSKEEGDKLYNIAKSQLTKTKGFYNN